MLKMKLLGAYEERFVWAIGLLSLADIALWGLRYLVTGTTRYGFITWNLILAWISPLMAVLLIRNLRRHRWSSWRNRLCQPVFSAPRADAPPKSSAKLLANRSRHINRQLFYLYRARPALEHLGRNYQSGGNSQCLR
jgi:hypothetical protein